ncbi:MAG TPA: hypothetical protein PLN31_18655, partial [Azoarcus taiwanensis]|nr:hypothetical protein [Azoarcus taiwanensis]
AARVPLYPGMTLLIEKLVAENQQKADGPIKTHIETASVPWRQRETSARDAAIDEWRWVRIRRLDKRLAVGEGPLG